MIERLKRGRARLYCADGILRPRQPHSTDLLTERFYAELAKGVVDGTDQNCIWTTASHEYRRLGRGGFHYPSDHALSGLDSEECKKIIDTYLPRTAEMAKAAVRKWDERMSQTGQKI